MASCDVASNVCLTLAAGIVDRLLQFLDHGTDYITAETLVAIKDLLRRHPRWADDCIQSVTGIEVDAIAEPAARAAIIFIYGEYGQAMPEAPYMLEPLLQGFAEEEAAGPARYCPPRHRTEGLRPLCRKTQTIRQSKWPAFMAQGQRSGIDSGTWSHRRPDSAARK